MIKRRSETCWLACVWLLVLGMATPAQAVFYNGPYLQQVDETSVLLMWETDVASTATVEYGKTQAYGQVVQVRDNEQLHEARLTNLSADTLYYYEVNESSGEARSGSFMTAPLRGTNFIFAAYGDSRSDPEEHLAVANAIHSQGPRLVVTTGDYVENAPIMEEWHEQFFVPAAQMLADIPILPAIGNHDSDLYHPFSPMLDYFPTPEESTYYSVDYGDIHFVVLDSNRRYGEVSAQYRWLESDLSATTQPVIIVVHHYPVYSSGRHGSAPMMDQSLRTLYERYGVTAVLNGHDHMYERSERNGINYFVLGGGGAGLYSPNDNSNPYAVISEKAYHYAILEWKDGILEFVAYRIDGSIIDAATLYSEGSRDLPAAVEPGPVESGPGSLLIEGGSWSRQGAGMGGLSALGLLGLFFLRRRSHTMSAWRED